MSQRVKLVIAAILGVPFTDISDEASPATIAEWDSLRHIKLMLAIEEEFGVTLTDEQVVATRSYADIRKVLSALGHTA